MAGTTPGKAGRRIACLFAPSFPLAARLRAEPELAGKTLVICAGNGGSARIESVSRAAWRLGIRPGITLARARSRLSGLIARPRDAVAEQAAHEVLLETAATLSPRIEDTREDTVFADVSGMEKIFEGTSGEEEMARLAILTAENLSLMIRVGLASAKLPARLAAQAGKNPAVIPPGGEAAFLAKHPLSILEISRKLETTFRRWGLRTLGDLVRLPAEDITARLGSEGLAACRAARGEDPEPLVPMPPPRMPEEGMELEWAVVTIEALLAALRPCLERLHARLAHRDLMCRALEMEFGLEPEGFDRRIIRLPIPARDVEALLCLTGLSLEATPPPGPIHSFRCIVHPAQPPAEQANLFSPPDIYPENLAVTLARLAARLGPEKVGSPRPGIRRTPGNFENLPFTPSAGAPRPPRGHGLLAVRMLRPPLPMEVIVKESPDGPAKAHTFPSMARPLSVSTSGSSGPRIQGLVRVASGPWVVEQGWWEDDGCRREYWDIEISGGGLYRIFRDPDTGEWYADGIYD